MYTYSKRVHYYCKLFYNYSYYYILVTIIEGTTEKVYTITNLDLVINICS
jgi:hypothetical protein